MFKKKNVALPLKTKSDKILSICYAILAKSIQHIFMNPHLDTMPMIQTKKCASNKEKTALKMHLKPLGLKHNDHHSFAPFKPHKNHCVFL